MPRNDKLGFFATRDGLVEALQQVPDGVLLVKNHVGNLTGITPDNVMVGYLDIHAQQWVPSADTDSDGQT